MSIESRYGWHDLRLAMEAWPERICEARRQGNWRRDERDFFLCFFVQCWSLVDWAAKSGAIPYRELSFAWRSRQSMLLCKDIANRYKHLTLDREIFDKNWSVWLDHDQSPPLYFVTAKGQNFPLWELMVDCISFWEEAAAAFHLDAKRP